MSVSRDTKRRVSTQRARRRRQSRILSIAIASVLALLLVGILILASWRSAENRRLAAEAAENLPSIGDPDAPVVMEEFSDFACTFCADFAQTTQQLVETYLEEGMLRVVHVPVTFLSPPYSDTAAVAAICAEQQGNYWEMYDTLFALYRSERDPMIYTTERILEIADALDLEVDTFETCLNSAEMATYLDEIDQIARARGVTSTPTIFINGERVPSTLEDRSFESLSALIESLQ